MEDPEISASKKVMLLKQTHLVTLAVSKQLLGNRTPK
jgi:hypothetical protein